MGEQECTTRAYADGTKKGGLDKGLGSHWPDRYRRKYFFCRNINLEDAGRDVKAL